MDFFTRATYLENNEQVTEADDKKRTEESNSGGIDDESRAPDVSRLRPGDVTGASCLLDVGKDDHRQNNEKGQRPHSAIHQFGHPRSPPL